MATFAERQSGAVQLFDLTLIERFGGKQEVILYKHPEFGHVLVIDGELHHVEAWADLYHEPLVHVAASFVPHIQRVLILGGGCLYAAHEVLKYKSVERVDIIEHDDNVLEVTKRNYAHGVKAIQDPRLNIRVGDVAKELDEINCRYDLLISDCIDFSKERRFGKTFHQYLESFLTPMGVGSEVFYRHVFDNAVMTQHLSSYLPCTNRTFSLINIPEYPGILHIHALWGPNPELSLSSTEILNTEQKTWFNDAEMDLSFYDPRHRAFFLYLPPKLRVKVTAALS